MTSSFCDWVPTFRSSKSYSFWPQEVSKSAHARSRGRSKAWGTWICWACGGRHWCFFLVLWSTWDSVVLSLRVSHHEAQNAPNTPRLSVTHTSLLPSTPGCSILYLRTQLPALRRESTLCSTHTHLPLFHVLFIEECLTGVLRKLLLSLPSLSVVTSSCQQSSSQKNHVLPMATFLLYQWPRVQTQLTFLRIHSFPE